MTEMTNSIIHIHKVLRSRDTTDKNIQQTLICALGHHDLAPTLSVAMIADSSLRLLSEHH